MDDRRMDDGPFVYRPWSLIKDYSSLERVAIRSLARAMNSASGMLSGAGAIPHAQGDLPGVGFVLADHQHVGHFHQLGVADLGVHALGAEIGAGADALVAQLRRRSFRHIRSGCP